MKTHLLLVTIVCGLAACHSKKDTPAPQPRDVIMANYFRILDSLPGTDSLDEDARLLRAYHTNDTAFLTATRNRLVNYQQKLPAVTYCEAPPPLTALPYLEAYRFSYGAAFCNQSVTITLGVQPDSFLLDVYMYQYDQGQTTCTTVSHTTTRIDQKDWRILADGLHRADFWGLAPHNVVMGLDGSWLTVSGYKKGRTAQENRYKTIYRWLAEEMAIGELFKQVTELCGPGIKTGCLWLRMHPELLF